MGGSFWSDEHYKDRKSMRARTGKSTFEYSDDITAGRKSAKTHDSLDPAKLKAGIRESRDSDKHPESNSVFAGFDVTGSMGQVPKTLQSTLPSLMGLLLRKSYLTDPAICVAGIGDYTCDRAPFQVGQFESGIEIENDLTNIYLEGGGGGHKSESYELAIYFLARKTICDCWEKRKQKGWAFLIGDEMARDVNKTAVNNLFGDTLQADIPLKDIVAEAVEKWELFFILPNLTSYYDDTEVNDFWRELMPPQHFVKLEDPAGISELIASLIGVGAGSVDLATLEGDLADEGASAGVAHAVSTAIAPLAEKAGEIAVTKDTGIAEL